MLTPPIPVVLPLVAAALLAAVNGRMPSRLAALLSIATAVATGGVCLSLIVLTRLDPLVYWFGGWTPRNGVAPGIAFAIDVYGATLAFLACLLVTAALVFSSRYFDTVGNIYNVLMLSFLAAMCGFCLTGDLFNLFVFFELMSAAAFALCGYKSEEAGPLEGTLNFAVTNTIGAFLALTGIALLYGRTGALNLAQIGRALAPAPDGLVLAAFVFIVTGFLVKAAVAPFHFWLADAHAVAPTPVCILFSGVMVELGLYAVARVYWTVFSGPLALRTGNLRNIFIGAGVLTALMGGLLCFLQRHIKRLLAFSTISHMGLMLIGFGLLTPDALAGTAVYVFSHGLVKAALFIGAGILLHRAGTVDEFELKGRGRHMPAAGAIFVFGALGLAGLPPFGTFTGEHLIDHAAGELGYGWLGWVGTAVAVLTSGAVLRVAGRVFAGWGPSHEVLGVPGSKIPEKRETHGGRHRTPLVMKAPAAALLVFALAVGFAPSLAGSAHREADFFVHRVAYAERVLDGISPTPPAPREIPAEALDYLKGTAGAAGAAALAMAALFETRLRRLPRLVRGGLRGLRELHSGIVCDYVAWLTAGVAAWGALAFVFLR